MDVSRRTTLAALTTSVTASLAGCGSLVFGGRQEYTPVVVENDHDTPHMMAFTVVSIPNDSKGGFTVGTSDAWYVDPGESYSFPEAIPVGDTSPTSMTVLVVLENETAKRARFTMDTPDDTPHIAVTETGDITVETRS
ncbi:hypothetical protein BRD20_07590 [Halobacteriales archaeon SW_8_65_20]|nr:MAG: hypothetical protein BRD20_07590 [Halobacteriales archaeon SW_8_65_20]